MTMHVENVKWNFTYTNDCRYCPYCKKLESEQETQTNKIESE